MAKLRVGEYTVFLCATSEQTSLTDLSSLSLFPTKLEHHLFITDLQGTTPITKNQHRMKAPCFS